MFSLKLKRTLLLVMTALLIVAVLGGFAVVIWQVPAFHSIRLKLTGKKTVADQVAAFGEQARERLNARFLQVGVPYPPVDVRLLFLKSDRTLLLFVFGTDSKWKLAKTYPVLGASGTFGPKLVEGDRQVPEGVYQVESLNPNSSFHLSLRLNYPNADDLRFAAKDNRSDLGSDIMIHGKSVSIGCIAVGDEAIEELFTLAAETRYQNWKVILAPTDLSKSKPPLSEKAPSWLPELYSKIESELKQLPLN